MPAYLNPSPGSQLTWSQHDAHRGHDQIRGPAWLQTAVAWSRRGEVQLGTTFVSILWLSVNLIWIYRNATGKRVPHKPRGSLLFETLSHALRGVTLTLFIVASSGSPRQWTNAISSGYVFLLGLFRIGVRGDNRQVLLHHANAVACVTLALSAASEVLPLLIIGGTYRPDSMTAAAVATVFSLNFLAILTPREWMPPNEDLNLPEDIKIAPTREETCSWLDYYLTFTRVDSLFIKGWKNSITMKELEEIPWTYTPELLRRRFSAARKTHSSTGWTLVVMLWPQLIYVTVAAMLYSASELFAPLSLFQLLEYLRAPEEAVFQPYVWLIIMFGGRMAQTLFQLAFAFTSRKISVFSKMMLTGEVYQTALRSRELQGNFLKDPKEETSETEEGSSTGMLENLISSDIDTIMNFRVFLFTASALPACVISLFSLHAVIGWPAFVGVALMLTGSPLTALLMKYSIAYEEKLKTAQDSRIAIASEYLRSIKVIKYFGWEDSVIKRVSKARATEQKYLWTIDMVFLGAMEVAFVIPIVALLVVFALYVGVEKRQLTASVAYTSITLLFMVRDNLGMFASVVMELPKTLVSLKRFDRFFAAVTQPDTYPEGAARIENATFRRSPTADFRLHGITIDFVRNGLNVITGISGSGKTTLLLALLGETVKESGRVTRERDAAFVSQSSWLQALSVRDNVIFNSPANEERYREVVDACCLDVDFDELKDGDQTKVGENGTALSGGQRARVALARALYANSSLLLLDDIFSALDTKTSLTLWNRAFCSDLLKNRTVILVTQLGWVVSEADLAIVMENGSVKSTEQNLGHIRKPQAIEAVGEEDEEPAKEVKVKSSDGAATPTSSEDDIDNEVAATGVLGGLSFVKYMSYFGGPVVATLTALTLVIASSGQVVTNYWMSIWVDHAEKEGSTNVAFYLGTYIGLSFAAEIFDGVSIWTFIRGSWFAARRLHEEFISAVMRVPLDWFRTNPVGRVINRLSGDIATLDQGLVNNVLSVLSAIVRTLFMVASITTILPIFVLPTVVAAVLGALISNIYNRTSLIVKQIVSASKSPVLSEFSEGLGGMTVIRAMSNMQDTFSGKMNKLLYTSARAIAAQIDVEQWLKFRMNILAAIINVSAGVLALVQKDKISAGLAGFCLSQATTISESILYLVFSLTELSVQMQTFHRVREYSQLPPEEPSDDKDGDGQGSYSDDIERSVPAAWPKTGAIEFRNVTIRHGENGPDVLKNINIKFNAGERVAVVGRTGSGKSTLVLSILRFTNIVSGQILYDGVDVTAIPRKQLRQAISTIPQEAQLFQGTLASNLDPSGTVDEAQLQKALDICQTMAAMKATETDADSPNDSNVNFTERLTLSTNVSAKGENFSHGQRQVLSLCRILVRRSKLMLLDEATSSMDRETDEGIQQALRSELNDTGGKSRCLITIAHRLQTIADYDKVVVMGSGEILEEGSPPELMRKKGHFYDMWLHSREEETTDESDA